MRHLEIEVTNADELLATEAYGAGAPLRWESSATETGTYVEGGTQPLTAGVVLYDIWDAAGIETTWYRTRISNVGATTFSAYSAPRSPITSVTSLAEVRALVTTPLSDIDLQAVIDREEAWLTGKVGQLSGPRTDEYLPGYGDTPLYLRRRAESVAILDAGVALAASEFVFTPSTGMIRRGWPSAAGWQAPVSVTYTPSDLSDVKRVVIELVRGTVGESILQSETIGAYSYTRGGTADRPSRAGLARSLMVSRPAWSLRLRSAMEAT